MPSWKQQALIEAPVEDVWAVISNPEELDDLREIKLRCQTSGYYSHWLLTEAQGNTSRAASRSGS